MQRKIIHIDMDAFYASVEQRDDPFLKGKPIIVGGSPDRRGVVSTASYEARKFGIRSAMPVKQALKLYPQIIIIQPNFQKYVTISKELIELYRTYTDLVEPSSLDECYLDVTENKLDIKTATEIGKRLKYQIKKDLNLIASVGIAPNKLIAKIASDRDKPNGLCIVKPHQVDDFMRDLPVNEIWGVGKVTLKHMEKNNIKTCSDIQQYTMIELIDKFGSFGETLYYFARGIDNRPVASYQERKSVGAEITFAEDTKDIEFIQNALKDQIERVSSTLKRKEIKAKKITLKIKYGNFELITRGETLNNYIDSLNDIYDICLRLFKKTEIGKRDIRLIGISTSNFNNKDEFTNQLDLDL